MYNKRVTRVRRVVIAAIIAVFVACGPLGTTETFAASVAPHAHHVTHGQSYHHGKHKADSHHKVKKHKTHKKHKKSHH